jgi:hypothetical protein
MMNEELQPVMQTAAPSTVQKPLLPQSEPLREPNDIHQDSGGLTSVVRIIVWIIFLAMVVAFLWYAFARPVPHRIK